MVLKPIPQHPKKVAIPFMGVSEMQYTPKIVISMVENDD